MFIRTLVCLALVALAASRLGAHDFWLAAGNWAPASGTPVTITAGVGEHFPARTKFSSRPDWFDQWRVIGAAGDISVGKDFLLTDMVMSTAVTLPAPGAYLGVMRVTPRTIEMKGQEFTDYLKEEGIETALAARQAAGETDKPAKEVYARYAKVALRTGAGSGAHLTRPAGLRAEFVPESDPTTVHPGQTLTVQLLAEGKPVAGATVMAVTEGASGRSVTDAGGRATLTIDREGAWLIKAVHMERLTGARAADGDWESYWVTLSFHTAH